MLNYQKKWIKLKDSTNFSSRSKILSDYLDKFSAQLIMTAIDMQLNQLKGNVAKQILIHQDNSNIFMKFAKEIPYMPLKLWIKLNQLNVEFDLYIKKKLI